MLDQLTRYLTAVYRFRRSERSLVRGGSLMDLEEMRSENLHPTIRARIDTVLNQHYAEMRTTASN